MAVAVDFLQVADELLHIVDIVIKVELAVGQGYGACVFPVGDIDLVVFQHGLDGVAQQGGVVAGQGSHDQHCRLTLEFCERGGVIGEALEAAQLAKRLVDFNPFVNGNIGAVHIDGLDVEGRLFVVLAEPVNQAVTGGHALGKRVLPHGRQGIAVELCRGLCKVNKGFHQRALGFINLIQHGQTLGSSGLN